MKEDSFKFPFNPTLIYQTAMSVSGYGVIHNAFPTNDGMCHTTAVILALEDLFEEYEHYGKTVSRNNITHVIRDFLDNLLVYAEIDEFYQTKLDRFLQIVEKSECMSDIINNVHFCLN